MTVDRRQTRRALWILIPVVVAVLVVAAGLVWRAQDSPTPVTKVDQTNAPPPKMVALGDSYTSGPGVLPYEPGTAESRCFRSENAYPELSGRALNIDTTSVACSGATTNALTSSYLNQPPQLDAVDDADVVVMSFGGNDVQGLQTLGTNPTGAIEPQFVANFESVELPALDAKLNASYNALKQRLKPGAKVFVVGYPNLFPIDRAGFQYCAGVQLTLGPAAFALPLENLHLLNAKLNDTIRTASQREGFTFVDVAPAFAAHDICSENRLIWGTVDPPAPEGALHPSNTGHQVMSNVLTEAIRTHSPANLPRG